MKTITTFTDGTQKVVRHDMELVAVLYVALMHEYQDVANIECVKEV